MPDPKAGESLSDFTDRCISIVMDEGITEPDGGHRDVGDPKEAYAICRSMYEEDSKRFTVNQYERTGTLHCAQRMDVGTEVVIEEAPAEGGVKARLLEAPDVSDAEPETEKCLADGCGAEATWQLVVGGHKLHYCDECLEGAVKALERHDLVLDGVKSLKEADKAHDGVILALRPPEGLAQELALEGPDALGADELHVTLCYLGPASDLVDKKARLLEAVRGLADRVAPFKGSLNGVTRFTETHNGRHAIVLNVDSPVLPELRQKLVDTMHNVGFDVDDLHGFTPHMTLAYIGEEEEMPAVALPEEPVTFDALWVFWGQERVPFPFGTELYEENEHGLKWETVEERTVAVDVKAGAPDLQSIAEEIAEGEGVDVDADTIREQLLEPWYQSTIKTPAALRLQKTAARTFGHSPNVHLLDDFEKTEINWDLLYAMGELYNRTQRFLTEEKGFQETETIPVYHPYLPEAAVPWEQGDEVRVSLNPLTSWTTDIKEAAVFAGFLGSEGKPAYVLRTYIPVKSIISTKATAFGETDSEVVLAGGEYEATVEVKAG